MEKECKFCGKIFEAKRKTKVFCSKKCSDNASKQRRGIPITEERKVICEECGIAFTTVNKRKRFCSKECKDKKRNKEKVHKTKTGMYLEEYIKYRKDLAEQKQKNKAVEKEYYKALHTVERKCVICGSIFYCLDNSNKKTCSKECSRKYKNIRLDKRIPKNQVVDTDINIHKLFIRDHGKCYICGCNCSFDDLKISLSGYKYPGDTYPEIEHVIPVSRGGLHSWDNVRLACCKCNAEKKDNIIDIQPMPREIAYSMKKIGTPAKKTYQYTLEGELIKEWKSTGQIERELGFSSKRIQDVCRGKERTAFVYKWQYA